MIAYFSCQFLFLNFLTNLYYQWDSDPNLKCRHHFSYQCYRFLGILHLNFLWEENSHYFVNFLSSYWNSYSSSESLGFENRLCSIFFVNILKCYSLFFLDMWSLISLQTWIYQMNKALVLFHQTLYNNLQQTTLNSFIFSLFLDFDSRPICCSS